MKRMRQDLRAAFRPRLATSVNEQLAKENPNLEGHQIVADEYAEVRGLPHPKLVDLEPQALRSFDAWRDKVLARVFEVVNTHENTSQYAARGTRKPLPVVDDALPSSKQEPRNWCRAIESPLLRTLSPDDAPLVGHLMLLLLLSLEHYDARSRTLLLYLYSSLHIPLSVLIKQENATAQSLIKAVKMNADADVRRRLEQGQQTKRWKVGFAAIAGAALIGITGGLAAPLVAAGIGSLLGGLGLTGTVAAAYLGALASSGAIVGTLFGAYGGKISGEMMERYAAEVEDFAFIPLQEDAEGKLKVVIGVSGWLTDEEEVSSPWHMLNQDGGSNAYSLRWEVKALLEFGGALESMVTTFALAYIKTEIIKRTVLASLYAALWPIALLKFSGIIDNPFSIAKARADKAGIVLADAIINRAQGQRPLTLVGYSLGSRVIYACLLSLAERGAFGLVENVILMGSPVPANPENWATIRAIVAGRVVNVYSANDMILAFLYRTSAIQLGVAGLEAISGVEGVESVDMGEVVEGHTAYRNSLAGIWRHVLQGEEVAFKERDEPPPWVRENIRYD